MKGILEEYFMSEDKQEASLCTTELQSKLPKENDEVGLHLLISQGLSMGAEKRDKERTLLEDLFKHMYEEKILSKDDFVTGFQDAFDTAEDLAIDFPKLFEYLASLLAKLILIDAVPLSYLGTDATEPLRPENKENLIILVLKAIKSEAPDKVQGIYQDSELEVPKEKLEDEDLSDLVTS